MEVLATLKYVVLLRLSRGLFPKIIFFIEPLGRAIRICVQPKNYSGAKRKKQDENYK